jgi:alanyl-tRNA synthetase
MKDKRSLNLQSELHSAHNKFTRRLFDEDPYAREFEASVLSVTPGRNIFEVTLDQTLFFPESGGQPSDIGVIDSIPVNGVKESDGNIIHIMEKPIEEGRQIHGRIDWNLRFDHMQQHTGQHILSQTFIELLNAETIGFHLGRQISTIDLTVARIEDDELAKVETRANEIVMMDKMVYIHYKQSDKLDGIQLRKQPDVDGLLRIVEIDQFDWSGCCGTHVKSCGEIGLIKILRQEKYKGGIRISFLCGHRALQAAQKSHDIIMQMSRMLSTNEDELTAALQKMIAERKDLLKTVKLSRRRVVESEAENLVLKARTCESLMKIVERLDDFDPETLQQIARRIVQEPDRLVVLCRQSESLFTVIARSKNVNWDVRPAVEKISELIQGRGGGGSDFGQITGVGVDGLEQVMNWGRNLQI